MAKIERAKLDWVNVDTDAFSGSMKTAFTAYQASLADTNKQRAALEASMTAGLRQGKLIPDGMEPVYAYRWGKVSVAFVEEGAAGQPGQSSAKLVIGSAPVKTARAAATRSRANAAHPE